MLIINHKADYAQDCSTACNLFDSIFNNATTVDPCALLLLRSATFDGPILDTNTGHLHSSFVISLTLLPCMMTLVIFLVNGVPRLLWQGPLVDPFPVSCEWFES